MRTEPAAPGAHRLVGPAVFLLSLSLLAFEIALLRVFSIVSYHHFAYMAVGVALLGFGASGTLLVLLRSLTEGREWRVFAWLLALTPPALLAAPPLAHSAGFDPTQLLWDPGQWWGLSLVYASFALPFLLGAGAIAVALQGAGDRVGRIYAWNLAGSGGGALGVLLLLFLLKPDEVLAWTVLPATLAAVTVLLAWPGVTDVPGRLFGAGRGRGIGSVLLVTLTIWGVARSTGPMPVIHFKGLPQVEAYPGAERVDEAWDPTGWVVAVDASAFRHAPGLSMAYRGGFPEQIALFVDGAVAGAATVGETGAGPPAFLDWLPTTTPYAVGPMESVLVVGSGGGTEVRNALAHDARRVTAVELVEPLVRLSRSLMPEAPAPYDAPGVSLTVGDARSFAAGTEERFSLVVLPVAGAFNATAAGIYSGGEDFLNTVEAYRSFLELLEVEGILAITRWTRTPARDNVRVIFTVAEALRARGLQEVGESLAFVRSWATGTLLVKPDGFSEEELERLKTFCESRYFDLDWPPLPGVQEPDFNRRAEPVYSEAMAAAVEGAEAVRRFASAYPFRVDPATDDRPYFGRFLRLRSTSDLLLGDRGEWVPFAEWGYLGVLATFVQSGLLAVLLMGLPVLALTGRRGSGGRPLLRPALYFGGIGFGFILVEIVLIQRLSLILGHPVYAASATLGALLVFSGLGSGLSDRTQARRAPQACLIVVGLALILALGTADAGAASTLPLALRGTVALAGVGLLGVAMGLPFPLGLRRLAPSREGVAWAWAANGVCSVLGSSLAILLGMELGSRWVILAGAFCYVAAALVARNPDRGGTE